MTVFLVAAILAAIVVGGWQWVRRAAAERQKAMAILVSVAGFNPTEFEHQTLTSDRIAPSLREKTDPLGRELENEGLALVTAYENITLGKRSGEFTPQWYYVAFSGLPVAATVFHLAKPDLLICSLLTCLSDGRRIITSNADSTRSTPRRAEIEAEILPRGATVPELLRAHRARVEQHLAKDGALRASVPSTAEALLADLAEQQALTHHFRKSIGWVTQTELIGHSGGDDALARRVYRHTRALLAQGFDPEAADVTDRGGGVVNVTEDEPQVLAAIEQARASVDSFIDRLRAPQAGDEAFSVKVGIREGANTEHLWLSQIQLEGDVFVGRIANTPRDVRNVREGQEWRVPRGEICDWTFTSAGKFYGNYTLRATKHALPAELRRVFEERLAELPAR